MVTKGISTFEIVVGTPGRHFNRGGVAYYANASDQTTIDGYKPVTVGPSIGATDIIPVRHYDNTPIPQGDLAYYG